MRVSDKILELARDNRGVITTSAITANGIHRGHLKPLLEKGKLEKAERGVYVLPETWEDEFVNLQARFKRGVFSHETALFLWDLTDRTPIRYSMTFPQGYNLTRVKGAGVKAATVKSDWYEVGKTRVSTPAGNSVEVYCAERTLCDLLRHPGTTDNGTIAAAFKRYVARKDKNIPLLSSYAETLAVSPRVRLYLEILL